MPTPSTSSAATDRSTAVRPDQARGESCMASDLNGTSGSTVQAGRAGGWPDATAHDGKDEQYARGGLLRDRNAMQEAWLPTDLILRGCTRRPRLLSGWVLSGSPRHSCKARSHFTPAHRQRVLLRCLPAKGTHPRVRQLSPRNVHVPSNRAGEERRTESTDPRRSPAPSCWASCTSEQKA
jgi:hypothetical protein